MSESLENEQPAISEAVSDLRTNLRENLKLSRDVKKNKNIDSVRVGIGELTNLKNYSVENVAEIAGRIKHQKRANLNDLNSLAHAFIQSSENITSFLNITGALNVLVKELTGNNTNTQILATECLCNLSLGTEIACEKLTLNAGTYLITFLNCPNERLALNSLWTLTNLAASGEKPLRILLSQELLKSLLALKRHNATENVIKDSYTAMEVIISNNNRTLLRPNDLQDLLLWVLEQDVLDNIKTAKLTFGSLQLFDFKFEDDIDYIKLIEICFRTLNKIAEPNMDNQSIPDVEFSTYVSYIIKITANLFSRNSNVREHFISYGFARPNTSMVVFFNRLFEIQEDNKRRKEVFWLVGTLLKNTSTPASVKYLESDDFVNRLLIPQILL